MIGLFSGHLVLWGFSWFLRFMSVAYGVWHVGRVFERIITPVVVPVSELELATQIARDLYGILALDAIFGLFVAVGGYALGEYITLQIQMAQDLRTMADSIRRKKRNEVESSLYRPPNV